MLAPLIALLFAVQVLPVSLASQGTIVSTAQGPVKGTHITPRVRQFLGIPYAAPPTGTNRFQPPQPAPVRSRTFHATAFGNSCPADLSIQFLNLSGLLQQQESVATAEDCLNLNIWAPAVHRPQGGAVMLWVYGGGDVFGTSNTPWYNGQYFVENHDDLVIVSFNYRTNIFGFPNAPQQLVNVGLLDLDAAIQWVHANIASFGGDPNRITIFGESAGAKGVDAYAYSHPNDTIVKGIIAESGTTLTLELNPTSSGKTVPTASNSSWNTVAQAVGCAANDTAMQFVCMQNVTWETLQNEVMSSGAGFGPYPDGQTFFPDYAARAANGSFLKVPFLVGNNADEGDIFVDAALQANPNVTLPVSQEVLSDVLTLIAFDCPVANSSLARVAAGVPTWRYRYEGVFPDLTDNRTDLRAYHSAEIPLVFGTYNSSIFPYSATASEVALSAYMQSAWVAFAQNPKAGLLSYGWPAYKPSSTSPTVIQLGNMTNQVGATFSPSAVIDAACANISALTQDVLGSLGSLGSSL